MSNFSLLAALLLSCFSIYAQNKNYNYIMDPNDPTNTRIYTLDNGLRVYMSIQKDEPRVLTNIAVKTGSKNDPSDCTGLAHYLEHMLFKGNSMLGTKDWNKEKVLLDEISLLYEKHKKTASIEEKKNIYKQIDSLSQEASTFAVANEYDKLVSSIGASGTNAYTSNERTVYVNEIPSNEIERWLLLESTRFKELTLRLFHTELETVYEEYNRTLDNDFRKAYTQLLELLYKNHPYGTRPTIGYGEHLKNPSMVEIHKYFSQYYVPNNMAILLSGDFNPDETIQLIDQYFGSFKPKEIDPFTFEPENEITKPESAVIYGPQREALLLGYRCEGASSDDAIYLELLDYMLNNGSAGLIDLNLIQKQKLLSAGNFVWVNKDYSTFIFYGMPKEGQSLEEIKDLLIQEIEHIKEGKFDDWMIDACIKNLSLDREQSIESKRGRISYMNDAFVFDVPWKEVWVRHEKMKNITQEGFINFVNEHFNDNYVWVEKRLGESNTQEKVEKPLITPLTLKRDEQSVFAKKFQEIKPESIEPEFVDYKKEITTTTLPNSLELNYIKNTTNHTFSFSTIIDLGSRNIKELGLAFSYIQFLGTSKYSPEEFKKELFKHALDIQYKSTADETVITVSGLQESFSKGLELLNHILTEVEANQEIYNDRVDNILKSRKDAKLDKGRILSGALKNYALYGANSPFTDIISETQLKKINPESLTGLVNRMTKYPRRYFYYGPEDIKQIERLSTSLFPYTKSMIPVPNKKEYPYLQQEGKKVYFTHFDMVQAEMLVVTNAGEFNVELFAPVNVHNKYFGSGLSSIVFQEIRESKALAYSASNRFALPSQKEDPNIITTYIGTQADKLPEAIDAMNELLNNMPKINDQFEDAKTSAIKRMASNRIVKSSIFWNYEKIKKLGLESDFRKEVYEDIQKLSLEDLEYFFNKYIRTSKATYLVIGNRDHIDFDALKKLGPVQELDLEEIFGY